MISIILGGSLILSFVIYGTAFSFAARKPTPSDDSNRVRLWLRRKYRNEERSQPGTSGKLKERINRLISKLKCKQKQ